MMMKCLKNCKILNLIIKVYHHFSYVAYYRGVQFDKLRQLTGYYSCYGYL